MADSKISSLTSLTGAAVDAAADLLPIVDVSATTAGSKKITVNELKTAFALGGAAALNVGTTAGTVAAGDDSRITGALQPSGNLSGLSNLRTSRANLGVAWEPLGTVSVTNEADIKLDNIFDSSAFDRYFITLAARPATGGSSLSATLRDSTPADVAVVHNVGFTSAALTVAFSQTAANQTVLESDIGSQVTAGIWLAMELQMSIFDRHRFMYRGHRGNSSNVPIQFHGGGIFVDTTARQGIKFAFSSGNVAAGTLTVWGIRKQS